MTDKEKEIALKVAKETWGDRKIPAWTVEDDDITDFASRFLTAIRESQEPVAWRIESEIPMETGYNVVFDYAEFPMVGATELFTTPPAKEQDGMVLVPREPTERMVKAGTPHTEGDYSLPYSLYKAMLTAWEKQ